MCPGMRALLKAATLTQRWSANVAATKCRAHRFAHCDHRFLTSRRRIFANVQLDPIGYQKPMPAERDVVIVPDSFMSAGTECGCER